MIKLLLGFVNLRLFRSWKTTVLGVLIMAGSLSVPYLDKEDQEQAHQVSEVVLEVVAAVLIVMKEKEKKSAVEAPREEPK